MFRCYRHSAARGVHTPVQGPVLIDRCSCPTTASLCATQTAGGGHRQEGFEGLGRPVVMGVAVSEREAANAFRVQRGENLRNSATAVVADQIYLVDVQGIEKFLEHLRISSHRYVLIRRYLGVAMCKQIHSYTSPDVAQIL